jgi:2-keto-3-deoxy-L-rhamnonate aldolase RhmA
MVDLLTPRDDWCQRLFPLRALEARPGALRIPSGEMKNRVKAAIADGRAALGYLVMLPAVGAVQALAASGCDFVLIDLEHAPLGIESAAALIAATNGTATAPLVRVPGPRSDLVKPALDSGAFGLVFPQIASVAEARACAEVSRYTPRGTRGYGPGYAALRWGMTPLDYVAAANDELLVVALIESLAGVAALDDVLSVEGLDVVTIARADLASSMGIPGQFDDPRLTRVVAEAEAKIRARPGVALGGNAGSVEEARAMVAAGYQWLVLGTDLALVQRTAGAQVAAIRG